MNKTTTSEPFEIEPWHQIAFDAITGGSESIGLMPCQIAGEPSACIVVGRLTGSGMQVMPLFVAITPGLDVTFPEHRKGGGGGGGPRRDSQSPARAFAINKATVTHG